MLVLPPEVINWLIGHVTNIKMANCVVHIFVGVCYNLVKT